MHIHIAGKTATGRRKNNQDRYLSRQLDSSTFLLAVADGVGGAQGGEIASAMAIDHLEKTVSSQLHKLHNGYSPKALLKEGVEAAQKAIRQSASEDHTLSNMATTLVALLLHHHKYAWCNIGDSRIYHFHQQDLKPITRDHSYVEELLQRNRGEVDESLLKKYENIITKAIDAREETADFFPQDKDFELITEKEGFLLCSDGAILSKTGTNSYLQKIFASGSRPQIIVEKTIGHAFENGSNDNITAVSLLYSAHVEEETKQEYDTLKIVTPPVRPKSKKTRKLFLPVLLLLLLSAAISYFFFKEELKTIWLWLWTAFADFYETVTA